jgi:lysozyme
MNYLESIKSYRKAAHSYLETRASNFTQQIDNDLDSALRVISNLPERPKQADTYNNILGIKPVLDQRILCLKLLFDRVNKACPNTLSNLDYLLDKVVRDLNKLSFLPKGGSPYKDLFLLDKEPSKKFNSPLVYKTNQEAIKLMHKYESCKLKAYKDPGSSTGLPITIGRGSTRINNKPIKLGTVITQAQADQYFLEDIKQFEEAVKKYITVPITENMFSATVAFTYNVGVANLIKSTFLKRINNKDFERAAESLLLWNKGSNGKILPGLIKRREQEAQLFLK